MKSSLVRLRTISPCLLRTVASTLTTLTLTEMVGGCWLGDCRLGGCWLCSGQPGSNRKTTESRRQSLSQPPAPRLEMPARDFLPIFTPQRTLKGGMQSFNHWGCGEAPLLESASVLRKTRCTVPEPSGDLMVRSTFSDFPSSESFHCSFTWILPPPWPESPFPTRESFSTSPFFSRSTFEVALVCSGSPSCTVDSLPSSL